MIKQSFYSYKQLAVILLASSLTLSVIAGYAASVYLKKTAMYNMARIDAKKSSKLIFESLYSGMQKGFNKQDITAIIARLNTVEPDMHVHAYRSALVASLYGEIPNDLHIRTSDPDVIRAMRGEEVLSVDSQEKTIRYLYPVKVQQSCLSCHKNAHVGDINGVIDISYPATHLKINLATALNYFALFLILSFAFSYAIFYIWLNHFLVSPLSIFVRDIKDAIKQKKVLRKVNIHTKIAEIKNLEKSFNKMISHIVRSRHKEMEQAYIDRLTGLPNRSRLIRDLSSVESPMLIILNIDSFKEVNDFYGIKVGDFIIAELGQSIKAYCVNGERVYRYSGDEYAVLLDTQSESGNLALYTDVLLDRLQKEVFMYNDYEISIHLSAGAAIGLENIVEQADMALKAAKKQRKNFVLFDPSMQVSKQYEYNIKWTRRIKEALEEERIVAYFQPILHLASGRVTKFESLARFIDEDGRAISPTVFLGVAKKAKLYPSVTQMIVDGAFRAFELTNFEFTVNLSVEDIEDAKTRKFLYKKLTQYRKPERVIFEIIESEGIENFAEVSDFIKKVKAFGAKIAIDDFGSGYSNFAYLLKLEVDFIKIDASIIKNIAIDNNSRVITKTIVDFCAQIGAKTVAEYVCSKEIFDIVKDIGVDYVQGYYIDEPRADFKKWVG